MGLATQFGLAKHGVCYTLGPPGPVLDTPWNDHDPNDPSRSGFGSLQGRIQTLQEWILEPPGEDFDPPGPPEWILEPPGEDLELPEWILESPGEDLDPPGTSRTPLECPRLSLERPYM